jgi:hypothetical protein
VNHFDGIISSPSGRMMIVPRETTQQEVYVVLSYQYWQSVPVEMSTNLIVVMPWRQPERSVPLVFCDNVSIIRQRLIAENNTKKNAAAQARAVTD